MAGHGVLVVEEIPDEDARKPCGCCQSAEAADQGGARCAQTGESCGGEEENR